MKRLLPILLVLLLFLTACDLRNRQSSEDFIPTGTLTQNNYWNAGNELDTRDPMERATVKTVQSWQGEIPLTEPVRSFSYQLPFIDLDGAQAAGCNQEIEERFGLLITQSLEAMERYEDPILERLSYSSFVKSGILTLRVDRMDFDGATSTAWYTVDAQTGEEVSVSALFSAAGAAGDPATLLNQAVTDLFAARFGSGSSAAYQTALYETQAGLSPLTSNRMHLTEDGSLKVAVELVAPDGGSSIEELVFP